MPIFSRRSLQTMLEENASFVTVDQLEKHVRLLNANNFQTLDTEWEVAVLNAFSKLGHVEHEPVGAASRPDIVFSNEDFQPTKIVADVTTVSDEGAENETPVKHFYQELDKRLTSRGLNRTALRVEIFEQISRSRKYRVQLAIPQKSELIHEIFNSKFADFLDRIADQPHESSEYRVMTEKTRLQITYDPSERYSVRTWSSYGEPVSITRNAVFNALKAKAKQLKRCTIDGFRVIVLCNGDCNLLEPEYKPALQKSQLQIVVEEFLRQHKSIDLVLSLSSEAGWHASFEFKRARDERFVSIRSFLNDRLLPEAELVRDFTERLSASFPVPANTPIGARETIRAGFDPKTFQPRNRGYSISLTAGTPRKISVSARTILALLAGRMTLDDFCESIQCEASANPFTRALDATQRIKFARIVEDRVDDSSIEFIFDDDPAVSDFVNPKRDRSE